MRKFRLAEIKNIISSKKISDQETLLNELHKKAYNITQATLSRDLNYLQVAKVYDDKFGFIYALPSELNKFERRFNNTGSLNGFLSISYSNNIAVISTLPGHANQVALYIDYKQCPEILGTIAGDDTIMLIMKEGVNQTILNRCLITHFPELEGRI